jgi:DNA-directed RNA polymerase specialized sigma24 family protein
MSAGKRPRKAKKPPADVIHKPRGVAIQAFLLPFIQAMGDAYGKALSILTGRAHIHRERAMEALQTLAIKLIERWTASARGPIVDSWPIYLAHSAFHILIDKPRKDQRLLTYGPFEPDEAHPGLPHPVARERSPEDLAMQNEEVGSLRSAAKRHTSKRHRAAFLWSYGAPYELIGKLLGVTAQHARVLKHLGCKKLRIGHRLNDSA